MYKPVSSNHYFEVQTSWCSFCQDFFPLGFITSSQLSLVEALTKFTFLVGKQNRRDKGDGIPLPLQKWLSKRPKYLLSNSAVWRSHFSLSTLWKARSQHMNFGDTNDFKKILFLSGAITASTHPTGENSLENLEDIIVPQLIRHVRLQKTWK